jgi:hypothetical protein
VCSSDLGITPKPDVLEKMQDMMNSLNYSRLIDVTPDKGGDHLVEVGGWEERGRKEEGTGEEGKT